MPDWNLTQNHNLFKLILTRTFKYIPTHIKLSENSVNENVESNCVVKYTQDQVLCARSVKLGFRESGIFGSAPLFQINLI